MMARHDKLIYKICYNYCQDPGDREDLRQEIIFQLWKAFPSYKPDFKVTTWMYRVALNTAVSYYRKYGRRKQQERDLNDLAKAPTKDNNYEEDRLEQLQSAINDLKPVDKALIILQLEGEHLASIAAISGLTETNVSTKLSRIKKALHKKLTQKTHE